MRPLGRGLRWMGILTIAVGAAWLAWTVILYLQWVVWVTDEQFVEPPRFPEVLVGLVVFSALLVASGGRTLVIGDRLHGISEPPES